MPTPADVLCVGWETDDTLIVWIEAFRKEVSIRIHVAVDELENQVQDCFSAIKQAILSIACFKMSLTELE